MEQTPGWSRAVQAEVMAGANDLGQLEIRTPMSKESHWRVGHIWAPQEGFHFYSGWIQIHFREGPALIEILKYPHS